MIAIGVVGAVALVLAALGFARSNATAVQIATVMDTKQEVPKPAASTGAGAFVASVQGGQLRWQIFFTKMTGAAGAAHIHLAPRGKPGNVAVALCGPCKSGQKGSVAMPAPALAAVRAGRAYVNVHTAKNAAGEIRGQLLVVG